jgi:hypothetical protein
MGSLDTGVPHRQSTSPADGRVLADQRDFAATGQDRASRGWQAPRSSSPPVNGWDFLDRLVARFGSPGWTRGKTAQAVFLILFLVVPPAVVLVLLAHQLTAPPLWLLGGMGASAGMRRYARRRRTARATGSRGDGSPE